MNESEIIKIREYNRYPEPPEEPKLLTIPLREFNRNSKHLNKLFEVTIHTKDEKNVSFFLKAKYWVGILKIGKYTIIIQPKSVKSKFIHMLSYLEPELAEFLAGITKGVGLDEGFFDGFIKKFLSDIIELLLYYQRKGYVQTKRTGLNVRGKINISESIKNNLKGKKELTYQYSYLTFDTFHNQILKYTLLYLESIIIDRYKSEFLFILSILSSVSVLPYINPLDIDRIVYNRFTRRYKKYHQICKLILMNNLISLAEGDRHFHCFYFNSWDIFERFLRKAFEKYLDPKYLISKKNYQKKNMEQSWDIEKVQPDITIEHKNSPILLLDAKYCLKRTQANVNQAGEYIRYLLINKFKVEYRYRNCILIYPKSQSTDFYFFTHDYSETFPEGGRVICHSIDLSKVDSEEYLKEWTSVILEKFLPN